MPRLQFSLRALLILMAVVGAAIVIYRSPWTETKEVDNETTTTQYHRSWTGKAVKHGLERITVGDEPLAEFSYEDGERRRARYFYKGVVYSDKSYRAGQLDGPHYFFDSSFTADSTLVVRGSYRAGKMDGTWQHEYGQIIEVHNWRNGVRHGRCTWTTTEGRVLQSAEYAEGRLTHWNGQPAAEEFRRWLSDNIPNLELQRKLMSTMVKSHDDDQIMELHYSEKLYYVGDDLEPLVVQWDHRLAGTEVPFQGLASGEAILEEALEQSHTLAYRYSLLHVVPITAEQIDWQDRTGVYEIRFPPGSVAEQYWLSPIPGHVWRPGHAATRIKHLFDSAQHSPVEVDTTAVDHLSPIPLYSIDPNWIPLIPRTPRDLVGQYLNEAGFFCELKDGKLVILPHLVPPQRKIGPGK